MAFNKIKETIASFKVPHPTIEDKINTHRRELNQRMQKESKYIRYGVLIVIMIPSVFVLSAILIKITNLSNLNLGAISILLGIIIARLYTWLTNELIENFPFHKPNPFFGSKIEETISAFKKSK